MAKKLTTAFGDVKKSVLEKPSLIIYLVDGSGSIHPNNFDFIDSGGTLRKGPFKEGLMSIASLFSKSKQCVVQFATDSKKECEPSDDLNVVLNSISNMKQLSTCTYTRTAIAFVSKIFAQYSSYLKTLFIISDGMPSIPTENPDGELEKLKAMGTQIFVLGVGDESVLPISTLINWSTNKSAWNISNFQDFKREMEMMKEQQDEEASSLNSKMNIDVYPLSTSIQVGQAIPLRLEIRPVDSQDTIPQNTIITFDPKDSYFEPLKLHMPTAATFSKPCEMTVTLNPYAGVKESDFKGQIDYKFSMMYTLPGTKREIKLIQGGKIFLPTGLMRGGFETEYPINVLLFGQRGNGKSATTNCLLTNLSLEERPLKVVTVRQADVEGHTTTYYQKLWFGDLLAQTMSAKEDPVLNERKRQLESDLKKADENFDALYIENKPTADAERVVNETKEKLRKIEEVMKKREMIFKQKASEGCRNVKLQVFDPWGTAENTYIATPLPMVLKGQLKPGADMNNVAKDTLPFPDAANIIHVVIFVLPLTMISIAAKVDELVKMMHECAKAENGGYDPILVVTHMDDFENEDDRKPFKDKIATKFPTCTILYHQNYTKERHRVLGIDLSARLILNSILDKYNTWKAMHPGYFDGVKWSLETVTSNEPRFCHNDSCNSSAQHCQVCIVCGTDTKSFPRQVSRPVNPISPRPSGVINPIRTPPTAEPLFCVKCGKGGVGKFCPEDGAELQPLKKEEPITDNELICIPCNKTAKGGIFCSSCGGPLQPKPQQLYCSKCGKTGTGRFCSDDGGSMISKPKESKCPQCHTPGPAGRFCPEHGLKYA